MPKSKFRQLFEQLLSSKKKVKDGQEYQFGNFVYYEVGWYQLDDVFSECRAFIVDDPEARDLYIASNPLTPFRLGRLFFWYLKQYKYI